jgi:hypothetical protein
MLLPQLAAVHDVDAGASAPIKMEDCVSSAGSRGGGTRGGGGGGGSMLIEPLHQLVKSLAAIIAQASKEADEHPETGTGTGTGTGNDSAAAVPPTESSQLVEASGMRCVSLLRLSNRPKLSLCSAVPTHVATSNIASHPRPTPSSHPSGATGYVCSAHAPAGPHGARAAGPAPV